VAIAHIAVSIGCTHAADPTPSDNDKPTLSLLVPAYFYPADNGLKQWDKLIAAADKVPIIAIVNPASGPGKDADNNYVKLVKRAAAARHMTLVGYVATGYGKRKIEEVEAEVDKYLKLYPGIQGIFFDEQASDADHVKYQAALYDYVHKKSGLKLVVTNPGTVCAEQYVTAPATDVVCVYEDSKPFDATKLPDWANRHAAAIAVLPYQVADAKAMREVMKVVRDKKLGSCYVTDTEGNSRWDRLPKYWDDEVAAVQEANQGK
jgi:hypothetical protein